MTRHERRRWLHAPSDTTLAAVVLTGLFAGTVLALTGNGEVAGYAWAAAIVVVLIPLTWSVLVALRSGRMGVDIIALLAMLGALLTGEYLAGAIIALMMSGGEALEEYAQHRAGRELDALVARAPTRARVRRGDQLEEVDVDTVATGDIVAIRAGEVVPVDGVLHAGAALVDQSALTGEPLPVEVEPGGEVLSGSANAGDSFELRATRAARESAYASIVRLVEQALKRKAPMVRMADRYSVVFLVVTLVLAGGSWLVTGDPIRALAVLVIATPCPLILAPPVALVAGTSRAARRGVIIKGSAAVERLGTVGSVLIDKTGTVTVGTPQVQRVTPAAGIDEQDVLHLAGSLEQLSVHTLAAAITAAAQARSGIPLEIPTDAHEQPGDGIEGRVGQRHVTIGSARYLRAQGIDIDDHDAPEGNAVAYVAADGAWIGTIELADALRPDARELVTRLGELGIEHVVMATGDHESAAHRVADDLGIGEVHAGCTPAEKLRLLGELRERVPGAAVVMVGDGVNDAPALAAADIGIAMGSAGATAASDAAEAVIIGPKVSLVADAIEIGTRSRNIALQSVIAGMALSTVGMLVAAAGYLPPVYGALAQEVIDVAVIVNALRALR